MLWYYF